jgi:hypothetical protein
MSVRSTSFHSAGGVPDRLHGANRGRWQSGCPTARHQQHVHEPADAYRHQVDLNLGVSKNTEVKLEYGGQFGSGYRSNEGILRVNRLF